MDHNIRGDFAQLLLTASELDELILGVEHLSVSYGYLVGAASFGAMKAALVERWAVADSLRTALVEARWSVERRDEAGDQGTPGSSGSPASPG